MPEARESFTAEGEKEQLLCYAWLSCQSLRWEPSFSDNITIHAMAPAVWPAKRRQIKISLREHEFEIESANLSDEPTDAGGRNQKNLFEFRNVFNQISRTTPVEVLEPVLLLLRQASAPVKEMDTAPVEESPRSGQNVDFAGQSIYMTYALMAINVIVFICMALDGAGLFAPDGQVHLNWGSNFAPLTLNGEWWRLFTSMFLHFGILHLAMNMFCLYSAGIYLEPLLGKARFLLVYLCTGVFGALLSLWWHNPPVNSAGASGAIFGLYGVFLALLTTKLLPMDMRRPLLQSCLAFIAYNLFMGLRGNIDNAAHLGGVLSGLAFGYLMYLGLREEERGRSALWLSAVLVIFTSACTKTFLSTHQTIAWPEPVTVNEMPPPPPEASSSANDSSTNEPAGADEEKYRYGIQSFMQFDEKGLQILNETSNDDLQHANDLGSFARVDWESAMDVAHEMKNYRVGANKQKLAEMLEEYAKLRLVQLEVLTDDLRGKRGRSSKSISLERQIFDMQKLIKKMAPSPY